MKRFLSLVCMVFMLQGAAAIPVWAETRALLIGVTDYDDDRVVEDLKGPKNDVTLLRDVLRRRGVSNITVLADGVEGAVRPTRVAIMRALADLAARAGDDDLVYIHLTGHGSMQRDQNGDETDGLDEVFLPIDAGTTPSSPGTISNAIVDDELGAAVNEIRATGADVWLVLDSCHSGTGLRATAGGSVPRFVSPAVFGADVASDRAIGAGVDGPVEEADLPGGYLAFYSARSFELSHETNFERATGGDAWYGVFSGLLAARLDRGGAVSYRQLFQGVLRDLNNTNLDGVSRLQTPSWEGTMIDQTVLGDSPAEREHRYALQGETLRAGSLHGLQSGTVVGLLADAADPADALIGLAQIEKADATTSTLRAVGNDCDPSPADLCRARAFPTDAAFGYVVAQPLRQAVTLSPIFDLATGATVAPTAPPAQALAEAVKTAQDAGVVLAIDPVAPDVAVVWAEGKLWFGQTAQIEGHPVGLAWDPGGRVALAHLLWRIVWAENLARTLSRVGTGSGLRRSPITIAANLFQVRAEHLAPAAGMMSPRDECEIAEERSTPTPSPLSMGTDAKQCDILLVSAKGRNRGLRSVNRVQIDSQYCVRVDHETVTDNVADMQVGPRMKLCSDCPNGYSAGVERLFLVVTEEQNNTAPMNLSGLLENCGGSTTRGAGAAAALDFLSAAAIGQTLRSSTRRTRRTKIWVHPYSWRILPREVAIQRGEVLRQ